MARDNQLSEGRSVRVAEIAALIAAVVSTVSVIGPSLGLQRTTVLAVTIPALFGSAFILIAGRRVLTTRTIPARIAIGGSEGMGKTVYTNVVAGRLGESESGILSFTPEARTAQQVYKVISGLRREQWPASTGRDQIDRYRGKVELLSQPLYSRLIQGRIEFDLELGDSAGELWDEVAKPEVTKPARLIDSTFFEYVGESSALLYFIAADTLQHEPRQVADHVDDLLSTLQVLRSIEARGVPQIAKPIGVVISKADLLSRAELEALYEVFGEGPMRSRGRVTLGSRSDSPNGSFLASIERLERLTIVMHRQVRSFEGFIVSALRAAQSGSVPGDPIAGVEQPIEWIIGQILRN